MNGIVRKEKLDALVRSDALDAIRKRKPLNPVLDGEELPPPASVPQLDEAMLEAPATVELVMECLNGAAEITETLGRKLESKVAELHAQLVEARHEVRELRHEISALRVIQEAQREKDRGERGERGPRGIPGAPGACGKQGVRGEKGAKGERGPTITGWEVDEDHFIARPVMSSGGHGPALNLRGLFEAYDNAVSESEDRDLINAAEDSRREAARQTQAAHWAK